RCLRVGSLKCDGALEETLDWIGYDVTLIEHVGRREARSATQLGVHELIENQENLERVDRAGVQIVVAIFGIVEVKAAKALKLDQARNDLLDVRGRRMMTQVHQALHVCAELRRANETGAPVRDHRRVQGRLVELVLNERTPSVGQGRDDHAHALEVALERLGHVELTRKIRAVADPDSERSRTEPLS